MTFWHEGQADRGMRMLAGILLLARRMGVVVERARRRAVRLWRSALGTGIVGWCSGYSLLGTSTTRTPWDALPELRDGTSSRLKNFIARRKPSSTACWCAVTRKMLKTSCRKHRTHD